MNATLPPPSVRDPNFRYVPAEKTNLHETFARIRAQLEEAKKPPFYVVPALPYAGRQ